ncbi:maleylpyruvate isomerase family mycothiol-dependent enzyme [Amycolatopsis eburnea]|uniref:Maleylpyruvate isomerase family mycothiol-dependent enzyme n=1 Tax=Amycolatopsis eburnea TaxID=2267691 RepID=A0A427TAE0_9PSEU|nr:maleylpyruvate isomerase family mycothiol-dependent enzyme [Amycolatopsis eburnea]RSD19382.1 maleylpyruvate isomerase family mycothiol-dependent enzyme [Amycolatopsis eburnea]
MSPTRWGPPIDVLPYFSKEEQALMTLLGALTEEDWTRPTMCAGWTVKDVAAHLLGDKVGRLSRSRDGHTSEAPRPGESFPRFIDRINEEWVVACRRLSTDVLLTMMYEFMGQTTEYWAKLDLDAVGDPVSWAGDEPAPRWLDAARDYSEFWVHHVQLREALEHTPLEAEYAEPIADTFVRALPHTLRDVEARVGKQVGYTVTGAGKWYARRERDGWVLDRGAPPSRTPLATVTTDLDTFWRLCTRNAADVSRVRTTGDENVCEVMLTMTSIIA